jgi:hypothetical protein
MYAGQANRNLAEEFAAADAPVTLEMTLGGAAMDAEGLYSTSSPLLRWRARMVWDRLSQRYAEQASGEVVAFVEGALQKSTFLRVELPALLRNPSVVLSSGGA